MKFFIAILTVATLASAKYTDEEKEMWQEFKLEHGKMFLSPGKEKARMDTFLNNAKEVKRHNKAFAKGEVLYEKGIHEHSDMSEEEFLNRFTGYKMEAEDRTVDPSEVITLRGTPPASVNWTEIMGPGWGYRYQAMCGSCWAFSTGAALETAYFKKHGVLIDVSEQQMIDCTYGTYGGCAGGSMPKAMRFIGENGGLSLEEDYPYVRVSGPCRMAEVPQVVFLNSTKAFVKLGDNDDNIKNALNDVGAVSVCIDATGWGGYRTGIISGAPLTNECGHAVAIVGYGTDDATGIPYWIVKNSWGRSWGQGGYGLADARRDPVTGDTLSNIQLTQAYVPRML